MTRAARTDVTKQEVGSPTSIYQRIRQDIESRIMSGAWPSDHRIPYEHELMEQYDCSRMTVSKAIMSLVESGLIVRRRRAGSFVARRRIESTILDVPDIQLEIESRGLPYQYELLERSVRPPHRDDALEVSLAAGGELLELIGLHVAAGQPFGLESRLISLAVVPSAVTADFTDTAPGHWLLSEISWTQGRHGIAAIHADGVVANRLKLKLHAACLQVDRQTWQGNDRVTFVRQIFPGDAYSLFADFGPAGNAPSPVDTTE